MMSFSKTILVMSSLVLSVLHESASAQADATKCYSIQDKDRQNYCLAAAKNQPTYCYSIKDRELQKFCLAQVKNQKTYCYSIQDRDFKNQCLSMF